MPTDRLDSYVGVGRSGHHLVVIAACVEAPHLILVGVEGLYTLVGLNGPQLDQPV